MKSGDIRSYFSSSSGGTTKRTRAANEPDPVAPLPKKRNTKKEETRKKEEQQKKEKTKRKSNGRVLRKRKQEPKQEQTKKSKHTTTSSDDHVSDVEEIVVSSRKTKVKEMKAGQDLVGIIASPSTAEGSSLSSPAKAEEDGKKENGHPSKKVKDEKNRQNNVKLNAEPDCLDENFFERPDVVDIIKKYSARVNEPFITTLCCNQLIKRSDERTTPTATTEFLESDEIKIDVFIPWIEKYADVKKSQLAVDSEALEKIEDWLREWKKDIKCGKSRKFLDKKKRRGSESDFVTSDEEESELKTKSLLLHGPTGCGKTATVITLAKKMGFKVVEVNFSTSRSGKDVLKRVEEATLSHRLESKQSCLLLFKDICLVEPKEDEGFGAAVAQLITTSCRPIVMTMTAQSKFGILPMVAGDCDSFKLDAKIEKKEPLWVWFSSPPASTIVHKVLLPIVKNEYPNLDANEDDLKEVKSILYSIARHCKGDVRRSINQLQIFIPMYNARPDTIYSFHKHLSPYIDSDFVWYSQRRSRKENSEKFRSSKCNNNTNSTTSSGLSSSNGVAIVVIAEEGQKEMMEENSHDQRSQQRRAKELIQGELKCLNSLVQSLDFVIDLDHVTTFLQRRSHNELDCDDDLKTGRGPILLECFTDNIRKYCRLTSSDSHSRSSTSPVPLESLSDAASEPTIINEDAIVVTSETSSATAANHTLDTKVLSSLIFTSDEDVERDRNVSLLTNEMEDYCGTEGDLASSGQFNYDNFAFVRTIIKTNKLNSVGPWAKRHHRVNTYFNRVNVGLINRICDTFDFESDLNIVNQSK